MQKFSSAGWREISRRFWKLFSIHTQHSIYCYFFVDLQNKEEPDSETHFTFYKAKAFLGMWTELVNLLTLQLGICGFIRLIPAWLCCYPM